MTDLEEKFVKAAIDNKPDQVKFYLQAGVDVNVIFCSYTALMRACWDNRIELVKLLLDAGADPNIQTEDGDTAIIRTSWYGHAEVVQLLVDAGADVDIKNNLGQSALTNIHWTSRGRYEVEKILKLHSKVSIGEQMKQLMDTLVGTLNKASYAYYVENKSIMTDYEFDMKLKQLQELEKEYPEFKSPVSPTQRVGGEISEGFVKVKHEIALLSLENTYNKDDVESFIKDVKETSAQTLVAELKIDGLSVSLTYENGMLVNAATRGDGEVGEDITENAKRIKTIPLQLSAPVDINVRGEIFMSLTSFDKLNTKRALEGKEPSANPRNCASGSVRQLDPTTVAERELDIFIHSFGYCKQKTIESQVDMFHYLKHLGFKVNPNYQSFPVDDVTSILTFCNNWETRRTGLDYEIDGMVIKVNEFNQQEEMGTTSKVPKWAVAYKFKAPTAITKLDFVNWQVGRTGHITPVANLMAVSVGGITLKRASLHNMDELERLGIQEGDMVEVERAAEVIPHILRVVEKTADSKDIQWPTECPICKGSVRRDGPFLTCENPSCIAKVKKTIENFASRSRMNIEYLGDSMIELLVDHGLVTTITDLYTLTFEQLTTLPRVGERSAKRLLESIEKSKQNSLANLLAGMGIHCVGSTLSEVLANKYGSLEAITKATMEDLVAIEDVGETTAQYLLDFFSDTNATQVLLSKLEELGLPVAQEKKETAVTSITGKSFVVTGTLSKGRNAIHDMIRDAGGSVKSSVSNRVNYLVVGENAGSKKAKAEALGVVCLTEEELISLIGE